MEYPLEILPHPSKKFLNGYPYENCFLIRAIDNLESLDYSLWDVHLGHIKVEALCTPRERICDLSTSLLGVFDYEHNSIRLTPSGKVYYAQECPPDFKVNPPEFPADFFRDIKRKHWCVELKNIVNQEINYSLDGRSEHVSRAICHVRHTPMRWNFWHHSISWYLPDYENYLEDLEDIGLKRRITKKIALLARLMLAKQARIDAPTIERIEEACYLKSS